MTQVDHVVAISHALADFVQKVERVPAENTSVVHYGLEPNASRLSKKQAREELGVNDRFTIGFIGRLVDQKGVDVLLNAFVNLCQGHGHIQLVVIGDGLLRDDLRQIAERASCADRITFTGWLDDAQQYIPAFDVMVVPSRWEGFGLVTLEAMNHSVPLVASRVSALPEIIIDQQTGYLVSPDSVDELVKALEEIVVADDRKRQTMGQYGYQRLLSSFSVEKMIDETMSVYQQVMA